MYYNLPVVCPDCGNKIEITQLGVSREWKLAINYDCPKCGKGGGIEIEFAYYVRMAVEEEGEVSLQ